MAALKIGRASSRPSVQSPWCPRPGSPKFIVPRHNSETRSPLLRPSCTASSVSAGIVVPSRRRARRPIPSRRGGYCIAERGVGNMRVIVMCPRSIMSGSSGATSFCHLSLS